MTVIEMAPRTSALDRVVATAKKMEEHEEFDRWQFADDVQEAVDELALGQNGFDQDSRTRKGNADTGFFRAINKVNGEVVSAGVVSVGRASIVGAYTTAKAWPTETRVDGANYWAHFELRGRAYDGRRKAILNRLARSHKGTVSTPQVRLWKQEQASKTQVVPFLEKVEKRLRVALKSATAPWEATAESDRFAIADILSEIAGEIRRGEFK